MKLSEYLKSNTQVAHQQLEKCLIQKLKSITSVDDYLKLLRCFYGFVSPLEERIDQYISESNLPDYSQRRKSFVIANDITSLNSDLKDIPLSQDIPAIENTDIAFGALYVLEGSTLGGTIISKMLSERLKISVAGTGVSYFRGYDKGNELMWMEFKASLDKREVNTDTLNAANQTFLKFKDWIEQYD